MIAQQVFLLCFLSSILGSHAAVIEKLRLVGAAKADIAEFPYQVSLRLKTKHFCGGSLISTRHVLTAGHCVYPLKKLPISWLSAVVGTNNITFGGDFYQVESFVHHPLYDSGFLSSWMYDIALIKLAVEVKLTSRVAPIPLPHRDVRPGDVAVVSGWGTMENPETPLSQSLRKLTLTIISTERCRKQDLPDFAKVGSTHICTYEKHRVGACTGDSGGPLVANGVLVGVVSGGIPCAAGYPDVFTNVYQYLDFIEPYMLLQSNRTNKTCNTE